MEFKCSICDYTSSSKFSAERHVNKQKKCGNNPQIEIIKTDILCEYCNKNYKTKDNLGKHLKICKVKKSNIEKELALVKKELQELRQAKTVNINNTNCHNTINNHYTIQLRPYNDPKLPDDINDIYEDTWERQKSIQTYLEQVHFNLEYPENHNICITNLRSKLAAKVFNGDRWETKDQDKILDEIIENTNRLLDKWMKTDRKRRERYEKSVVDYIEQVSQKKFDEETRNEVKLLMYDNYKSGLVDIKSGTKELEEHEHEHEHDSDASE